MPRKPTSKKPKQDNPAEYKRFLETAKAVEVDEDSEAFERAFKLVVPQRKKQG